MGNISFRPSDKIQEPLENTASSKFAGNKSKLINTALEQYLEREGAFNPDLNAELHAALDELIQTEGHEAAANLIRRRRKAVGA